MLLVRAGGAAPGGGGVRMIAGFSNFRMHSHQNLEPEFYHCFQVPNSESRSGVSGLSTLILSVFLARLVLMKWSG
jgi:hypothetical protein